jgi:hypothetical protein
MIWAGTNIRQFTSADRDCENTPREDLICISQKTSTIGKDYWGENRNHFLPSRHDKNRNLGKSWFPILFDRLARGRDD